MPLNIEKGVSLSEIQKEIVRIRAERGFSNELMHIALLMCEEVGEILGQIRKTYVDGKEPLPEDDKSSLKHEIADVFILLNALAAKVNVDVEDAWRSKETINDKRDWGKFRNGKGIIS